MSDESIATTKNRNDSTNFCRNCKKEGVARERYAPTNLIGPNLPVGMQKSIRNRLLWTA